MKTACVIAEYHPFHNGHAQMADHLHKLGYTAVIAIMSGNLVQRGVPALLPKQVRAAAALRCGVDLVLELPCQAAAATAQRFAAAGVAAAAACGADALAFGAEQPQLEQLAGVVRALDDPRFDGLLRGGLAAGRPFYAARAAAAEALYPGAAALLAQPNNILGIEYLLALRRLGQAAPGAALPAPLPLPRYGAAHNGVPVGNVASAAWLRGRPMELWAPYVPAAALEVYRDAAANGLLLSAARWECVALAQLRRCTPAQLAALPDTDEGLSALLYTASRSAVTLDALYAAVKSKRYTHARIRRLALAAVMGWQRAEDEVQDAVAQKAAAAPGVQRQGEQGARLGEPRALQRQAAQSNQKAQASTKAQLAQETQLNQQAPPAPGVPLPPASLLCCGGQMPYLRVLGATQAGRQALRQLAARSPLPVGASLAGLEKLGGACAAAARREAAVGDLYALCLRAPAPCGQDYRLPFLRG